MTVSCRQASPDRARGGHGCRIFRPVCWNLSACCWHTISSMRHRRPPAPAEPDGRSGPGRSLRMLPAGGFALSALLALGAWGAVAKHQTPATHPVHSSASVAVAAKTAVARHRTARPPSRTIYVASGATLKHFEVSEPAGVIRLLRVTV